MDYEGKRKRNVHGKKEEYYSQNGKKKKKNRCLGQKNEKNKKMVKDAHG